MTLQPNITCAICLEKEFHLKEGFYYCNECGTKSDYVRAIDEEGDTFGTVNKYSNKVTIKRAVLTDKAELTSWECYNYILFGLAQELVELGARNELKEMVFQIWAAFLRNNEVAFFSRHPELPKLGIRFEKRDVSILYNHAVNRKKAKLEKRENASSASGSRRAWRKQMKKFDRSQYEASLSQSQSLCSQSFLSQSSIGGTSLDSSKLDVSNLAIKLNFSTKARKQLKQKMPLSHLKKHENDFMSSLNCHSMNVKESELTFDDRSKQLNMKLVYAILAVALNLVGDEVQLTDLIRFFSEGHLSINNIDRFFPSEVIESDKTFLKSYRIHFKSTEFSVTQLRRHCASIGKAIHLKNFKTPDMLTLINRYTTELALPKEINTFIRRLLHLHPPEMNWAQNTSTPCYESRAMAYIIFAIKLLFGLDGHKENEISQSAQKVNALLEQMDSNKLFVWGEWVAHLELRKAFLCKHKLSFCKQFNQIPPKNMFLHSIGEKPQVTMDSLSKEMIKKQENTRAVFLHFLNVCEEEFKEFDTPNVQPSFTPCQSYMKRLKLDPKVNDVIPEILNVDHSKCLLSPFLGPTDLGDNLTGNKDFGKLSCTSKQNFVGIFRNPLLLYLNKKPKRINLTNEKKLWSNTVEANKPAFSIFKTNLESYRKKTLADMRRRPIKHIEKCKQFNQNPKSDNECLAKPQTKTRQLNLFGDLSDDELQDTKRSQTDLRVQSTIQTKLKSSNFDCWVLMGKSHELNDTQINELKQSFPSSFFWLLETCALTIGVDWRELYDQLMTLETCFAFAIEPVENIEDRILFKDVCEIKDINKLVRHFQTCW